MQRLGHSSMDFPRWRRGQKLLRAPSERKCNLLLSQTLSRLATFLMRLRRKMLTFQTGSDYLHDSALRPSMTMPLVSVQPETRGAFMREKRIAWRMSLQAFRFPVRDYLKRRVGRDDLAFGGGLAEAELL